MNEDLILNIQKSWRKRLKKAFESAYFLSLKNFLVQEYSRYTVYPSKKFIFSAFNLTPIDKVKVVIIGQDPYHGVGQANGLCFSVADGLKIPPSLKNIYKELKSDLKIELPTSGNLELWATQGVLMLNTTLTVRASEPTSHQNKGWEEFTDVVIKTISEEKENIVFLLWGKFAQSKTKLIDLEKHHVLLATHPSPFSAYRGFFGCRHFSKTNKYLEKTNQTPIDWRIY